MSRHEASACRPEFPIGIFPSRRLSAFNVFILTATIGLAGGCRTPAAVPEPDLRQSVYIAVLKADPVYRYVILECRPPLPAGTEIDLFRDNTRIAKVRMTDNHRSGKSVATYVSGEPALGDLGQPSPSKQEIQYP